MSSASSATDPGWQYGHLAPQNKKTKTKNIICKLCGKMTSGGLSRFKKHIACVRGDVAPCPNSTEEDKRIVSEHLELLQKNKGEKGAAKRSKTKRKEENNSSSNDEIISRKSKRNKKNNSFSKDKINPQKNKKKEENNSSSENEIIPQKRQNRQTNRRSNEDNKKLDTDIFETFLEDLWNKISEEKRGLFAYFDSLWFSLYKEERTKIKVLEWIKNKDIFSRKYVFVPIVCWSHWSLLILVNFGESNPCMILLDSLFDTNPKRLEPDIRRFILDIYEYEGREENKKYIYKIPLLVPKVPQQTNGEECGSYVLYFIYRFLENAPNNFNLQDYPYFLQEDWFTQEDFKKFSEEIESFSLNKKKMKAETKDMSCNESDSSEECQIISLD